MAWTSSFKTHPKYEQAVRFATGRPSWVLKATGLVAVATFVIPLVAVALVLIAAAIVTMIAWTVFSMIARVIDTITGQGRTGNPSDPAQQQPTPGDGRENVRVIHRH